MLRPLFTQLALGLEYKLEMGQCQLFKIDTIYRIQSLTLSRYQQLATFASFDKESTAIRKYEVLIPISTGCSGNSI